MREPAERHITRLHIDALIIGGVAAALAYWADRILPMALLIGLLTMILTVGVGWIRMTCSYVADIARTMEKADPPRE